MGRFLNTVILTLDLYIIEKMYFFYVKKYRGNKKHARI